MTIFNEDGYVIETSDGITVQYFFTFPSFTTDWIYVYLDKVPTGNFSVTLNGDQNQNPGGFVVFNDPPAAGVEIRIVRQPDFTQETAYNLFGRFPSRDHEEALDKNVMMAQYLLYLLGQLEAGDPTLFVRKAGDQMFGQLLTLDPTQPTSAVNRRYVEQNFLPTAGAANIISSDSAAISVVNPSIVNDVTLQINTNTGSGLLKLDAAGLVPVGLLPPAAQRDFQGLWDASGGTLPPTAGRTNGDYWLISVAGTVTLVPPGGSTPVATPVEPGDEVIWSTAPSADFYLAGRPVSASANAVSFDDSGVPITASNVQVAIEQVIDYVDASSGLVSPIPLYDDDGTTVASTIVTSRDFGNNQEQLVITLGDSIDPSQRPFMRLQGPNSNVGMQFDIFLSPFGPSSVIQPSNIILYLPDIASAPAFRADASGISLGGYLNSGSTPLVSSEVDPLDPTKHRLLVPGPMWHLSSQLARAGWAHEQFNYSTSQAIYAIHNNATVFVEGSGIAMTVNAAAEVPGFATTIVNRGPATNNTIASDEGITLELYQDGDITAGLVTMEPYTAYEVRRTEADTYAVIPINTGGGLDYPVSEIQDPLNPAAALHLQRMGSYGFWGLGSNAHPLTSQNLNQDYVCGMYRCFNCTNRPANSGSTGFFMPLRSSNGPTQAFQLYFDISDGGMYKRTTTTGTWTPVGGTEYPGVINVTGSRTLLPTDSNNSLRCTGTGAATLTIADTSTPSKGNTPTMIVNERTGDITVSVSGSQVVGIMTGSGITVSNAIIPAGSVASLTQVATNTWRIWGQTVGPV